jgi:hypothetical protein
MSLRCDSAGQMVRQVTLPATAARPAKADAREESQTAPADTPRGGHTNDRFESGDRCGQAPRQVVLDRSWLAERHDYRCSICGEFCGKIRKESFQLRSCPFREDLSQRWRGAGPIIMWSGSRAPGKIGVAFDDRHLLEGVGQYSGGQQAGDSTAKNHRVPAPIHRRPGS